MPYCLKMKKKKKKRSDVRPLAAPSGPRRVLAPAPRLGPAPVPHSGPASRRLGRSLPERGRPVTAGQQPPETQALLPSEVTRPRAAREPGGR